MSQWRLQSGNSNKGIFRANGLLPQYLRGGFYNINSGYFYDINGNRKNKTQNKAIKLIQGKEMITHQIKRLQKCRNISDIVLCTSTNIENNDLISIANHLGIKFYRGSENNVLDRFYNCAKNFKLKHIIRCTGDCPLVDPNLIDSLVN